MCYIQAAVSGAERSQCNSVKKNCTSSRVQLEADSKSESVSKDCHLKMSNFIALAIAKHVDSLAQKHFCSLWIIFLLITTAHLFISHPLEC